MEDRGKAIDCFNNNPDEALFCLFDGHGGGEVSKYLQDFFHRYFKASLPSNSIETTLIKVFQNIDDRIKKELKFL